MHKKSIQLLYAHTWTFQFTGTAGLTMHFVLWLGGFISAHVMSRRTSCLLIGFFVFAHTHVSRKNSIQLTSKSATHTLHGLEKKL